MERSSPGAALPEKLTPFAMVLTPTLAFANGRQFSSGNNAPLADYFYEGGNSVYINTPDIIAFNGPAGRAYIVNQDDVNGGIDLNVSASALNGCERAITVNLFASSPPVSSPATFTLLSVTPVTYPCALAARPISQSYVCAQLVAAVSTAPVVSPNPANDVISVSIGDEKIARADVFDLKGNRVAAANGSERTPEEVTIDVSSLSAGVYVVTLITAEGVERSAKFVKQ